VHNQKYLIVTQPYSNSNRNDDNIGSTDRLFELANEPLNDSFWSEIFSTQLSLIRASDVGQDDSHLLSERVIHPGYITFQTSRKICPDDRVASGNEYLDSQNFGTARQTLHIKWGKFNSGLHFFTGSISEAGSYYITGASRDLNHAAPSILDFEFYAEEDKPSEILALRRGTANLRTEFAQHGVPGAQSFLERFRTSHQRHSSLLSYNPQLKLRIPGIEQTDELDPDDAPQENEMPRSPTTLQVVSPSARRLIQQLSELSRSAFFNACVKTTRASAANLMNEPSDHWTPVKNIEPGMLTSITPELLTKRARVRFSTPCHKWPSMTIFIRVPTRSSPHRDDLKGTKLFLAGPANRFGLREIYSINNTADLIKDESLMLELFEALHTINLVAHRADPTKLSSLLYVASSAGIESSPASLLAHAARRHKKALKCR